MVPDKAAGIPEASFLIGKSQAPRYKAPNPKHQISNNNQISSTNDQNEDMF
jgi:hypothetical protein